MKVKFHGQMWWCMPVILVLGRLRQEDHEFQASLGDKERLVSKKKKIERKIKTIAHFY
jgi:hypothetical protein